VPDPTNPADLPASWLPGAVQSPPMPPAKARAIARTVKNRRHALVLAMATKIEDDIRASVGEDATMQSALLVCIETAAAGWWKTLAATVGHPSSKPPSPETRAAVIEKVRADLAAPYRAKGRG
jgi:hypothetical protein